MKKFTKKSKAAKSELSSIPRTRELFRITRRTLRENYRPFLSVVLIFGLAYAVFVGISSQVDPVEVKDFLDSNYTDNPKFINDTILLGAVLGGGILSIGQAATSYGLIIFLISSLAYVWLARQVWAGKKLSVADAFYKGMYPLVQAIILLFALSIQLLPLTLGNYVLVTSVTNGLAASWIENVLIGAVFLGLAFISAWFATPTIIAFYISTLPNMTPIKAWKSAKALIKGRRLAVMGRIISGALCLLLLVSIILLLVVATWTGGAVLILSVLTALLLPVVHVYLYALYRSL